MTRVNLVPPQELYDQHLFAEWRELKMIPRSLVRSLRAHGVEKVLARIPPKFCLGTGHVSFFYDKGVYLLKRYGELTAELVDRGYRFNLLADLDPHNAFGADLRLQNDWEPCEEDYALIRARIAEKVAMKSDWYKYRGA